MSIYTPQSGLSPAFNDAINRGIEVITDPREGIVQHLLNGDAKALIVAWRGPLDPDAFVETTNAERGDGSVTLVHPGDALYRLPSNIEAEHLNVRMGVPLWVLGWQNRRPITLAMGLYHPLFSSASLDVFSPQSGRHLRRFYLIDHRVPPEQRTRDYAEWKAHCDQGELDELGARLTPQHPLQAPVWPVNQA